MLLPYASLCNLRVTQILRLNCHICTGVEHVESCCKDLEIIYVKPLEQSDIYQSQ